MRKVFVAPVVAAALAAGGGADAAAETEPLTSVDAGSDVLAGTEGNDTLRPTDGNDTLSPDGNLTVTGFDQLG